MKLLGGYSIRSTGRDVPSRFPLLYLTFNCDSRIFNFLLDVLGNRRILFEDVMSVKFSHLHTPDFQKTRNEAQSISMPILKDTDSIVGLLNRCFIRKSIHAPLAD